MSFDGASTPWIDGIDVSDCHCIDFDTVAEQDGNQILLGDNGVLIHSDPDAMAIIAEKRLTLACGPRAGCDGRVILPPPFKRVTP